MPINYSLLFGDAASQTFPATAAGTYNLSTPLAAGLYEITTDTSQSSFTLGLSDANGIKYTGTIRGGKGYISAASSVTKIVIPASMTYPVNINIRLGSYTQIAAPSNASLAWLAGSSVNFTFTAPSGATDMIAYWRDGTSTSLGSTTSPINGVAIPGSYTAGSYGYAALAAKDANGVIGSAVLLTTSGTYVVPPFQGGIVSVYSASGTQYLSNTFTGTGTLTVNSTCNIEYMVVGGGGGGGGGGSGSSWNGVGGDLGGGGGAGGLVTGTKTSVAPGTYTITIGGGGAHVANTTTPSRSTNGSSSTFGTPSAVTVAGGGGGGVYGGVDNGASAGASGACGGGGGMSYGGGNFAGGTATVGYAGGAGRQYAASHGGGGGGGGMGAVGSPCENASGAGPAAGTAGAGGVGVTNSFRTGSPIYYAGGGGGSSGNATVGRGAGGLGGGGIGMGSSSDYAATNGAANTGGGGGAGSNVTNIYALGGSGIVVLRAVL